MIWALCGFAVGMVIAGAIFDLDTEYFMPATRAERLLRKARAREAAKQAYKSKLSEP